MKNDFFTELRSLFAEEALELTSDELRKSLSRDGINPDEIVVSWRKRADELILQVGRERREALTAASTALQQENVGLSSTVEWLSEISITKIKEVIAEFTQKPDFSLAYRDGENETENDLRSRAEDLIAVGALHKSMFDE